MPNFAPPFGLDAKIVIRNPDNFPRLLLRGIYDVMKREEEAGRGSLMERFVKGFNVVVYGLVRARPPRLRVTADKSIEMINYGFQREIEINRGKEQKITQKKMKELYRWLDALRAELPENQPQGSPTTQGGG